MEHKEIIHLFKFLDNNKKNFTKLQGEFIDNIRQQFKITGLLTSIQQESLLDLKDKANSNENIPDQEFVSALYGQLQDNYY